MCRPVAVLPRPNQTSPEAGGGLDQLSARVGGCAGLQNRDHVLEPGLPSQRHAGKAEQGKQDDDRTTRLGDHPRMVVGPRGPGEKLGVTSAGCAP